MFISRNEQQRYSVITLIRFQLTEIGVATWHLYNPNHWTRFVAGIPINQKQYRLLIPGTWTLTEQWLLTAWFAGKHTFISKVHGPWWIVTQLSDNQVRRHGDRNSCQGSDTKSCHGFTWIRRGLTRGFLRFSFLMEAG